ncbi:hypothetical protein PoB_001497000 [Plakobranchus ocellatus]|uniref:Uncharacterized protein n=1 Tax=Plakobranchus ocellatus TaxID=259542 RepID=A0AAV3Z1D7_9GAST|nr:hypothetical protein PoB_001497000 [Plakobranchus ocellatus]
MFPSMPPVKIYQESGRSLPGASEDGITYLLKETTRVTEAQEQALGGLRATCINNCVLPQKYTIVALSESTKQLATQQNYKNLLDNTYSKRTPRLARDRDSNGHALKRNLHLVQKSHYKAN